MSETAHKPSSEAKQESATEALNKRHDRDTQASTESGDAGGLAQGGGLGGEAGVTSPGNAADGGPSADPGHAGAAKRRDAADKK